MSLEMLYSDNLNKRKLDQIPVMHRDSPLSENTLCGYCNNLLQCTWASTHKQFCEHYE
jgi:hypothetical protein